VETNIVIKFYIYKELIISPPNQKLLLLYSLSMCLLFAVYAVNQTEH